MLPDEMYKRKHYGTPQSFMLIITNYAVFAAGITIFAGSKSINWFFWVVLGLLALYNYFNIRKDREEYNRFRIIAYITSIVLMVVMFVAIRLKA
jgi:hypothetical protein